MKHFPWMLSAGLLFVCGLEFPAQAEEKSGPFEGTWELTYFERGGQEVKLQAATRLISTGAKFVVKRGDQVIAAGTGSVYPDQKPPASDTTYTEGPDKGKTFKGIYQLEGDKLTFCRAGSPEDDRPAEFKTAPGSNAFIAIYKRVKP